VLAVSVVASLMGTLQVRLACAFVIALVEPRERERAEVFQY